MREGWLCPGESEGLKICQRVPFVSSAWLELTQSASLQALHESDLRLAAAAGGGGSSPHYISYAGVPHEARASQRDVQTQAQAVVQAQAQARHTLQQQAAAQHLQQVRTCTAAPSDQALPRCRWPPPR